MSGELKVPPEQEFSVIPVFALESLGFPFFILGSFRRSRGRRATLAAVTG
jgi:hypothetical protein